MDTITFMKAAPEDAAQLTFVAIRAFESDIYYGAPAVQGPPGYNSAEDHTAWMGLCDYYKILRDGQIIGGIMVSDYGAGHFVLSGVFLDPVFQNRGIGKQVMAWMEQTYAQASRWTLDTPVWNQHTRHFYEQQGYHATGYEGDFLVLYEKIMS